MAEIVVPNWLAAWCQRLAKSTKPESWTL